MKGATKTMVFVKEQGTTEQHVAGLLNSLGVEVDAHTVDTPTRVAKAWKHRLSGYSERPEEHLLKTFPVQGEPSVVCVHGVRFASTCAHHLLPITGTATIAYKPNSVSGRVVGLSKLVRTFDAFARRLQVQEQLGSQTVGAIMSTLNPVGACVVITAEHGCMTVRGVQQPATATTTIATGGHWDTGHADVQFVMRQHAGVVG